MKVDLKTLATILGLIALVGGSVAHFGGFYYTTQLRLESLEEKTSKLEKKIQKQDRKKNKGNNK
jgi:hypothetical protein